MQRHDDATQTGYIGSERVGEIPTARRYFVQTMVISESSNVGE